MRFRPGRRCYLPDPERRQRLGLAAEMRIGQDLGESPAWRNDRYALNTKYP
jgi:hypothetical protein